MKFQLNWYIRSFNCRFRINLSSDNFLINYTAFMKSFLTASLLVANLAYAEEIVEPIALVEVTSDEIAAIAEGVAEAKDLL